MDWKANILISPADVAALIRDTKRIAVLGIKPKSRVDRPAFYVPKYMADAGYEIVPVPVYYPEVTEILGEKVCRNLTDIPGEIDMVNVFRRSEDVHKHTLDILACKPKSVWLQLGIRDDDVAEKLAQQGIKVVQDMCLMVEHRYLDR
jgi:predicted CoA-binding protein